jgi:uncharacterized protein (TIGR03086 family)
MDHHTGAHRGWDIPRGPAALSDLNRPTCADATLAVLQHVLRRVDAADLAKPTPCPEYTVGQLGKHLVDALIFLTEIADAAPVPPTESAALEARVAFVAQQAVEAWARRGLQGTVPFGPLVLPAALVIDVLSLEFLVHAWDVARATGQDLAISEHLASYVLQLAEEYLQPHTRDRGWYAAAVDVAPDAPALERLIAFSGRPAWHPALPPEADPKRSA